MTQTQIHEKLNKIEEILSKQSDEALSHDEAAAYLHISSSYLYKLCHKNLIVYYKSAGGKLNFYKKSDLDKWLFNDRQSSEAELEQEAENRLKLNG